MMEIIYSIHDFYNVEQKMIFYDMIAKIQNEKKHIIDLSTGHPFIPNEIKYFLRKCLNKININLSSYDEYDGVAIFINKFKDKIVNYFLKEVLINEITVTPGAQAAIYYLHQIFTGKHKKILYPLCFEFIGGVVKDSHVNAIFCDLYNFLTDEKCWEIDCNIDWRKIGAVFLSCPHNPTSIIWPTEKLIYLANFIARYGCYLIIDETYALPFAPLTLTPYVPAEASNIIHIYSFSKVGLASERVGIVVANQNVISKVRDVQRRIIIQTPKIGQILATKLIIYFTNNLESSAKFGKSYYDRWKTCVAICEKNQILDQIIDIKCWGGGPFLWLEMKSSFNSPSLFHNFLKNGVAVMPSIALQVQYKKKVSSFAFRIGLGSESGSLFDGMEIICKTILQTLK